MEPSPPTYRALLSVPGYGRIVAAAVVTRTALQMYALVLVLFVLARTRSPQLAGIAVMMSVAPGVVVGPLAGAVLDRGARLTLIAVDYCVGALSAALLWGLASAHRLPVAVMLGILGAGSLTQSLSNAGLRSLFPLLVPSRLWDRANAVDSGGYVVATVAGPAVAGAVVALVGPTAGLLAPAVLLVLGALCLVGVRVPAPPGARAGIFAEAWAGLRYVARHPALRMLAVCLSVFNVAWGAITVGLPVLVERRLHGGSTTVGALFAVMGVGGVVAGFVVGRSNSEGRERRLLTAGCLLSTVAVGLVALGGDVVVVGAGMALLGLANGPIDIGLFSLRQRTTDPAWYGRAFAVSMALNFVGVPVGSALAGPALARSVTGALLGAAAVTVVAAAVPLVMGRDGRSASPVRAAEPAGVD